MQCVYGNIRNNIVGNSEAFGACHLNCSAAYSAYPLYIKRAAAKQTERYEENRNRQYEKHGKNYRNGEFKPEQKRRKAAYYALRRRKRQKRERITKNKIRRRKRCGVKPLK